MTKERGNGANAVVLNRAGMILVAQQNYGENKWMLPGGEIERGELATHAAQEETEEETGILIDAAELRLIAYFVQRPRGFVFLFEATRFTGNVTLESTDEILQVQFMSIQQIIDNRKDFGLGYMRMILQYVRCVNRIDPMPFEGRLSNPVEFPKDIKAYESLVLRV